MLSKSPVTSIAAGSLLWVLISSQCYFLLAASRGQEKAASRKTVSTRQKTKGTKATRAPRTKTTLAVRLTLDDGQKSGGIARNDGYEEGNTSAGGNSVRDSYPDYLAGDRINPKDWAIKKASLSLHGVGRGRWKLVFPNHIKVWRSVQGKYRQVLSGVAAEVTLPQTIPLLLEGIENTASSAGFKLVAALTSSKSKKSVTDAVSLTVHETGLVMGVSRSHPSTKASTEKVNPWRDWPACTGDGWAQGEAQALKSEPGRPSRAAGNGLPVVAVTSPARGAVLKDLTAITGTVKPASPNTSVKRVELSLSCYNPISEKDSYWNGALWINDPLAPPMLTATVEDGRWLSKINLPGGRHLKTGTYSLEVRAYDNFDGWGYTLSSFVIDRSPRVTITAPARESSLVALPALTGTVTAATPDSLISGVKLRLHRSPDPEEDIPVQYWNGKAWVSEPSAPLSATYQRSTPDGTHGTWQLTTFLPPEATLTEGNYQLTVAATDQAGNTGCAESQFLIWRRPKLSITAPALKTPDGEIASLKGVEGTVELVPGGTPVTKITLQLWRQVPGSEYWDGTRWVKEPATSSTPPQARLPVLYTAPAAPGNSAKWTIATALPPDATLQDGEHNLIAEAYNGATVIAHDTRDVRLYRGPSITIAWPKDGTTIEGLDAAHPAHGTAQQGVTGSPIASVTLNLYREEPSGKHAIWSGKAWIAVSLETDDSLATQWTPPATPGTSGTWKRGSGWPSAGDTPTILYYLTAAVRDAQGRAMNSTISFRMKKKPKALAKKK